MFNFDSPLFQLLFDLGIDLSSIDISSLSENELFVLGIVIMIVVFVLALIVRSLFYCISSIFRSCLR